MALQDTKTGIDNSIGGKVPFFKITLIFKPNFVDHKFLHSKCVYTTESVSSTILLVNTFRPCLTDFIVSYNDVDGSKKKYTPDNWDEYVYSMQFVTGIFQPDLFNKNKTA